MARLNLLLFAASGFVKLEGVSAGNIISGPGSTVNANWLGGQVPVFNPGTTFGLPWPRSKYWENGTSFTAVGDGDQVSLQSWVTGYWSDGSIKWTGHAIATADTIHDSYTVLASSSGLTSNSTLESKPKSARSTTSGMVSSTKNSVTVNTGKLTVTFPKHGKYLVGSITTAGGKTVGKNGRLVLHSQSAASDDVASRGQTAVDYFNFDSNIEKVVVDEASEVRALVTVRGTHKLSSGRGHDAWLPFVLRFYMYTGSSSVRVVHSLVFDGNADKDFISGVGLRFDVPLAGEELYNRHVRFSSADGGLMNEAVQGITGLRRDPGEEVRTAQFEGQTTPDISTWDTRVSSRMQWIPAWNDYSLTQLSSDGYTLKKRTKPGQGWVNIPGGTKAGGLAYLGGATVGGLAVGLRDLWKKYPTGLEITNAASNGTGELTLWLYSPSAPPLDIRPYHDMMGMDTYDEQLDALEITYEDYEPDFNTPYGIARTSEIYLFGFEETPSRDELATLIEYIDNPPVLVAEPKYIAETKALGAYWAVPDSSASESEATIETHLDFLAKFYQDQISQRRFYGFLDYGDFMHTYDEDRHTWRYDVGGFAWDNSELSPDLFFWQYFLRTGREDVYRFAEALTRHSGEVDVYHIGDWKGLGTRHGVQHWADSAKQARISQPQYRKYFYYLSGGDERVGELMEECLDTDLTYGVLDPLRKVRTDGWTPSAGEPVAFSLGTDWSALAAGWLIEWERRGSRWEEAKTKLTNTATGIAKLKYGFVTGSGLYDPVNWTLGPPPADPNNGGLVSISHLSAVFGLPEVVSEMIDYWGDDLPEGFEQAWLDYCYYYGATSAEQKARYGSSFSGISLVQAHSRLTAYAASRTGNSTLAARAWSEFKKDGLLPTDPWSIEHVNGSAVLEPVDEATWLATNDAAQYGLAAIQNLAFISGAL